MDPHPLTALYQVLGAAADCAHCLDLAGRAVAVRGRYPFHVDFQPPIQEGPGPVSPAPSVPYPGSSGTGRLADRMANSPISEEDFKPVAGEGRAVG